MTYSRHFDTVTWSPTFAFFRNTAGAPTVRASDPSKVATFHANSYKHNAVRSTRVRSDRSHDALGRSIMSMELSIDIGSKF